MSYSIQISTSAEQDIIDAVNYIKLVLKSPDAAERLYELIAERLFPLKDQPELYPIVDDPVLKAWGIRFVSVQNYLAFYTIDEKYKTIYIVRFLYKRRNWKVILKD